MTTTNQITNGSVTATPLTDQHYPNKNSSNGAHIPGQLRVIRRTGDVVSFDITRIKNALIKAFVATEGQQATDSPRVIKQINDIAAEVSSDLNSRYPGGGFTHIEEIQDRVVFALMRNLLHQVAVNYIIHRNNQHLIRQQRLKTAPVTEVTTSISVKMQDGSIVPLDERRLETIIDEACQGLENVDKQRILNDTKRNLYPDVPFVELNKAMILSARAIIEKEPNYTYAAARLLQNDLRCEALNYLGICAQASQEELNKLYPEAFAVYLEQGIKLERLSPKLRSFDLKKIANAIQGHRDLQFTYLGLQTLYDRYFLHDRETRFELPQLFFMRVAMGLALGEKENHTEHAIDFYNLMSTFDYMPSTPTLFNAGTNRPQLSSCFLTTIDDDLEGIYNGIKDNALLAKFAGGIGNDWTPIRAIGAPIKGTNGKSLGVVPFMNVANATAIAVNQGGKRKGAVVAYLEAWHLDIEEFLELRKNTGDDRRRTHDMNTAIWVPDLLMKRLSEGKEWTLFSPDEVPKLHDLYGKDFEAAYLAYEEKAQRGDIRCKRMPALSLYRKMLSMLYETGHPWITFKDPCNLRSPQQHAGVVHSSNLCTEITLNTSKEEIAVCNLGSINLVNHVDAKGLDVKKLQNTIKIAIRMLDNVIDINYYTVPQARRSNLRHRPVGMGIMGFHDALFKMHIPYASEAAIEFADSSMEMVSYYAIKGSADLAKERGSYESYEGSLWSKGILPIDSIKLLEESRGADYLNQDRTQRLDWNVIRTMVATTGMRNSNVMAIAPTATISNICGVSQSIEPTYRNLFVKSNMSGEFTVINPYLVEDLKQAGLWDDVMINDLKYFDGCLQNIQRIPENLKQLYATAFEIEPRWLVESASRRQKWIDQSQSLNLYMAEPSGKKLDVLYRMAWILGLKTTYYMRSMGASNAEKSTVSDGALNAVKITEPLACSIDNPECESCQ